MSLIYKIQDKLLYKPACFQFQEKLAILINSPRPEVIKVFWYLPPEGGSPW